MTYTSRTAEFRADVAELLAVYRADGFSAADRRAHEIVARRSLDAAQRLTLADGFRRAAILGA
jgi:hypothetical protein